LLWHKKSTQPKVIEVYVPIASTDTRSYAEKWKDPDYLASVASFGESRMFLSEGMETLKQMRVAADVAKTPDQLLGVQACIKLFKDFLCIAERAKRTIKVTETLKKAETDERENE
jgi:hypothetical protein